MPQFGACADDFSCSDALVRFSSQYRAQEQQPATPTPAQSSTDGATHGICIAGSLLSFLQADFLHENLWAQRPPITSVGTAAQANRWRLASALGLCGMLLRFALCIRLQRSRPCNHQRLQHALSMIYEQSTCACLCLVCVRCLSDAHSGNAMIVIVRRHTTRSTDVPVP
jgi:hypothetical protein